jgi:hypothetical protein
MVFAMVISLLSGAVQVWYAWYVAHEYACETHAIAVCRKLVILSYPSFLRSIVAGFCWRVEGGRDTRKATVLTGCA